METPEALLGRGRGDTIQGRMSYDVAGVGALFRDAFDPVDELGRMGVHQVFDEVG